MLASNHRSRKRLFFAPFSGKHEARMQQSAAIFGLLITGAWVALHPVGGHKLPGYSAIATPLPAKTVAPVLPKHFGETPAGQLALKLWPRETLALYRQIFELQGEARWQEADRLIAGLNDPLLFSYVLAERYRHPRYVPNVQELTDWLERFSSSPQAPAIYDRLAELYPRQAKNVPAPVTRKHPHRYHGLAYPAHVIAASERANWKQAFTNFHDGKYTVAQGQAERILARSGVHSPSAHWLAGLSAWMRQDYPAAAQHFSRQARTASGLPAEHSAAAAFWAYRSYTVMGNRKEASRYLTLTANYPYSFYGMLANNLLGRHVPVPTAAATPVSADELVSVPVARRVVLLKALGKDISAAEEVRQAFLPATRAERMQLARLTRQIGLNAVRLPLEQLLDDPAQSDAVMEEYPMPEWTTSLNRNTNVPLVLAIVRQESGFDPQAGSHRGAKGLMQIMPTTARYVVRNGGLDVKVASADNSIPKSITGLSYNLLDADFNLKIGQAYLNHLSEQSNIGSNLVYLLAAYNAGPGNVQRWQERLSTTDPLLFIETVPYAETRRYIRQVMKSYWVYQRMFSGSNPALAHLARQEWPKV